MEQNIGNLWHPVYRSEPLGHFAWRKHARVYCWWSGVFFDFSFTVKRRCNRHRWHRCRRSFLRYHRSFPPPHTSHRNRILPDDPDDDFRIVVIPKRFSLASLSREPFSIILTVSFFKHALTNRILRREKWLRTKSLRDISLLVLCAVPIFVSSDFGIFSRLQTIAWRLSENNYFFDPFYRALIFLGYIKCYNFKMCLNMINAFVHWLLFVIL